MGDSFDLQVVPRGVGRIVIGSGKRTKLEADLREWESDFGTLDTVQKEFDGGAIGNDGHGMQAPIVKSSAVEGSHVVSATGRHIAILTNFTVVTPAALSPHIGKKNVVSFRLIKDPQGAARSGSLAGFSDTVNGDVHRRVLSCIIGFLDLESAS